MQYIVLDLEWNQPLSYNSSAYRAVGGKLLFEMIQIGAIRLDESLEIRDTFNQLIQPTHYVKLHPRIRRITGISQEDLCDAPQFAEAAGQFFGWCGSDCALLTWGCDDISVLRQNLDFFECGVPFPPIYDIQRLYGELTKETKNRAGLKSAMEHFGIEPDETHPFHNALNDAYYTSLVFKHLPDPKAVLQYPQTARKLLHAERKRVSEKSDAIRVGRVADALQGKQAQTPPCPVCGHRLPLAAGYLRMRDGAMQALCQCPDHGLIAVRLRFDKDESGKRVMRRSSVLLDEQNPAYISTKILQWQSKLAAQAAADEKQEAQPAQ